MRKLFGLALGMAMVASLTSMWLWQSGGAAPDNCKKQRKPLQKKHLLKQLQQMQKQTAVQILIIPKGYYYHRSF